METSDPKVNEPVLADVKPKNLFGALARAQGAIAPPIRNQTVDFTDKKGNRRAYKYADLSAVIECIRKPLSENGLSVSHILGTAPGDSRRFGCTTRLLHESGESLDSFYPLPDPSQVNAQDFGSAITYARRYSISALLSIASEEDDDGALAAQATERTPARQRPEAPPQSRPQDRPQPSAGQEPGASRDTRGGQESAGEGGTRGTVILSTLSPATPGKVSAGQWRRMFSIAKDARWTESEVKSYLLAKYGGTDITVAQYDDAVNVIQSRTYQWIMRSMGAPI